MKFMAKGLEIEVREGAVEDVPLLLSFIRKMGEFEKLEVTATEETLRDSLFGENPAARVLLAFAGDKPAAYAVYFFTFGTMVGKRGLWLDDIYVEPEFRGKGIARGLMGYLAEIAIQNNCGRFEWMVLDWNTKAIDFYDRLGAELKDDLRVCRLDETKLAEVAKAAAPSIGGECR